ncbi:MAG: hypothetical protein D6816_19400 [Bacteroidetes bacterium]|nr:MAG: hypothetical protein D6816_19400 [Bacteroidota bacterium]
MRAADFFLCLFLRSTHQLARKHNLKEKKCKKFSLPKALHIIIQQNPSKTKTIIFRRKNSLSQTAGFWTGTGREPNSDKVFGRFWHRPCNLKGITHSPL